MARQKATFNHGLLVLEVTHSGSRSEFRITGTIQGISAGLNDLGSWNYYRIAEHPLRRFLSRPYFAYPCSIGLFVFGGVLLSNYESNPSSVFMAFTAYILVFSAGVIFYIGRSTTRKWFPTTLDVSSE